MQSTRCDLFSSSLFGFILEYVLLHALLESLCFPWDVASVGAQRGQRCSVKKEHEVQTKICFHN